MLNGVDVSIYQPNILWGTVAKSQQFAILKIGGSECGRFEDKTFRYNLENCKANGIKVGGYFMGGKGFTSADAGRADALFCLQLISGLAFDFPVFIDLELPTPATREGNTDAVISFCDMIRNAGYKTGIYASDISGFKERLDFSRLGGLEKWVARYGSEPTYVPEWDIWQYSSSGAVAGINGRVDVNYSKKDYSGGSPEVYVYMGVDFSPVFNPDYYAEKYADLKEAFGYNHAALWQHFTMYGIWEFRQASAEFNPVVYRDRYPDLEKAYADYNPLYYWHYCYFGKKEGRSGI